MEAAFPIEASPVTIETPFKIEEGEPHDKTLEKTDYRDKVTSMIAVKAEWVKVKDLDNLREEKEELQEKIRVKEIEFEGLKVKVTEMIDNQAKEMTNCISVISKTEDEKAENNKEIKKLRAQIVKIEERQRECTTQIENMERKKKELEKFMDTEMSKMEAEEVAIAEDIERLNKALRSNIKATEDLVRLIFPGRFLFLKACIFSGRMLSGRRLLRSEEGLTG